MADLEADPVFTIDIVRDFILSHDGKVSNNILVNHFKHFLNDPQRKTANRQQFKSYVNTLASIKLDTSGDKLLILKKKFRDSGVGDLGFGGASGFSSQSENNKPEQVKSKKENRQNLENDFKDEELKSTEDSVSGKEARNDAEVKSAKNEVSDPFVSPMKDADVEIVQSNDVIEMKKEEEREVEKTKEETKKENQSVASKDIKIIKDKELSASNPSLHSHSTDGTTSSLSHSTDDIDATRHDKISTPNSISTESVHASATESGSGGVNVRDFARNINKLESEVVTRTSKTKRESRTVGKSTSNDSGDYDTTLNELDREWIIKSAYSDYHAMVKMLQSNSYLARKKDFITGYTALHWACKNGQMDVVKLLCGTHGADVNIRSQGGYTPLHLATIHNHEDIVEIMIRAYAADPSIRDYGGKTAKQYLSPTASSRSQQLLQPRRVGSSINSSNPTAFQAGLSSGRSNLLPGSGSGKENTSPLPSPVSTKPFRHEDYSALMPPPRELPPVARRKLASSRDKTSSHSDSEMKDDIEEGMSHGSGSSPNFGTIV